DRQDQGAQHFDRDVRRHRRGRSGAAAVPGDAVQAVGSRTWLVSHKKFRARKSGPSGSAAAVRCAAVRARTCARSTCVVSASARSPSRVRSRASSSRAGRPNMTDPIADFLARIRNGILARKNAIDLPTSKMKLKLAELLRDEGYLAGVTESGSEGPQG